MWQKHPLCFAFQIQGSASTCSRTDQANGNQNYCGTKLNTGAGHIRSVDICGEYYYVAKTHFSATSYFFLFSKDSKLTKCLKFTLTDCTPLFGIRVHTDAVADYGSAANTNQAPTDTISGVCLDFTHVPCNQL